MNGNYLVCLDHIYKTFYTHHFFHRDDGGRLRFHVCKSVNAAMDIGFGIKPGEIFGLLGPNGAGKTTTVKMVSGLVRPDKGVVYVDGMDVERKRLQVLRRVGVVLEGTRTSIWPLTPFENLMYFGNLKDVKGNVLRKRATELLYFIGLREKMHIQVRRLSRGEKQKLAICIALIADPPVILLDEPTTGLDVQSGRSIKDKIVEMTRQQGKCVLVTTHDMSVAQELCDRIGIINHGRMIACRRTEDLLSLFGDMTFEFRLDRLPTPDGLVSLPGVKSFSTVNDEDGPLAVVAVDSDPALRSQALYGVTNYFQNNHYQLRSIAQRQQTLENVFLRLTSGDKG